MRAWLACAFLFVVAGLLDAPRDLMLATIAAFIICFALFALQTMRHTALEAAVATLPEPAHSSHIAIIAESILRTANTRERDASVLERTALTTLRLGQLRRCKLSRPERPLTRPKSPETYRPARADFPALYW
jgi:hypothetical protein